MKTKKEIIQETVEHIENNGRSIRDDESLFCMYRNSEGRKCAVGMWIPDDKYDPVMDESGGVGGLNDYLRRNRDGELDDILMSEVRGHDITFWVGLQRLHDDPAGIYWNNSQSDSPTLTEKGEEYVEDLIERHN